jgi:FtsP/CotA-like multicopper oxidase with cupredoxin domain
MPAPINRRLRRALSALCLAIALVAPAAAPAMPVGGMSAPAITAAVVGPDLCAVPGSVDLPGAPGVPIWGFALRPTPTTPCSDVTAQLPGPGLEFATGDVVTLSVTNAIPGQTISLIAPGLSFDPGPTDAAPGETVTVTFTAGAPGTYLYSSVGDAGRQQAMGLYGALLVCSTTPCPSSGSQYGSPYDRAATLVLSEIDTALNTHLDPVTNVPDPSSFDMRKWAPGYWLINGRAHPDSPDITATAGDRVLLRYLSAGPETVTMTMLGMHGRVLARDAFPLTNPIDVVSETVPAGSTADMIATVPAGTPSGTRLPLYNRQLRLNNGAFSNPQFAPADGGGMMTFLHVP